ncbi:MAG: hypothetical protein WBE34_00895 [Candidatus Nitrosopolaris sp.]
MRNAATSNMTNMTAGTGGYFFLSSGSFPPVENIFPTYNKPNYHGNDP